MGSNRDMGNRFGDLTVALTKEIGIRIKYMGSERIHGVMDESVLASGP